MIDLPAPVFEGNEKQKLEQLTRYTADLHDTLSRKFENIDITDLNYTLAEMIRNKPKGEEIEDRGKGDNKVIINNYYFGIHTDPRAIAQITAGTSASAAAMSQGDLLIYVGRGVCPVEFTLEYEFDDVPDVFYSVGALVEPPNMGQNPTTPVVSCSRTTSTVSFTGTACDVEFILFGVKDPDVVIEDNYVRPAPSQGV